MNTNSATLAVMYAGRSISGLGVGIISCVAPVLLSEIAASSNRGTITTMHQVQHCCVHKFAVVKLKVANVRNIACNNFGFRADTICQAWMADRYGRRQS
jgi:hypothetical protein